VASYTSDGSTLTLDEAGGAALLVFSRSVVGLVGAWEVTAYNNGKHAVVSVLATTMITMSFAENGRVAGDAGVNRYGATYTTSGTNAIKIGLAATTRQAGPAEAVEQEREFLAALSASKIYRINGQTLELLDPAGALQAARGAGSKRPIRSVADRM
jgi:heat shock protein HslJ